MTHRQPTSIRTDTLFPYETHFRSGLALDVKQNGRGCAYPGRLPDVLGILPGISHVAQAQGRPVFVSNDQLLVVLNGAQLIIGINGGGALGSVQIALGLVDVCTDDGRSDRKSTRLNSSH